MSKRSSTQNKATFLMDGEEFFGAFTSCLQEVKSSVVEGAVPPKTYVRLAYWAMEKDLRLSLTEAQLTLESALKELADLGVHVEIILWDPDALSGNVGGDKNFATKVAHGNKAVHKALHGYKGKILVCLESHPKVGVGYGLHQKMSIFSVSGKLKALVGGFNMEQEYWDTAYHWGAHPITHGGHTLHDTAVLVEGPVTCDVEEEWLRRWKGKLGMFSSVGTKSPDAVRAEVRALVSDQPRDGDLDIAVLTTGVSAWSTEHSIRDEIKTLIQGATTYLYVENYQFFDPEIVTEVCRKLKAHKPFQVCVVIPDSACDPTLANTQLSRIAYTRMLLASFKEKPQEKSEQQKHKGKLDTALLSIKTQSSEPVNNEEGVYYKVLNAKKPSSWMEGAKLQKTPLANGKRVTSKAVDVALETIDSFVLEEGHAPRVQVYCPVRFSQDSEDYAHSTKIYVHSKMMLIDSLHVIVGSANFGYRSMEYDGEMSLHIRGAGFALAVKQKLFPHYNVNSVKEVPGALRDSGHAERNRVKLVPRTPGQLGAGSAKVEEKLPLMNYSWF